MSPLRPSQSHHRLLCQSRCTLPPVVHAPAKKLWINQYLNIQTGLTEVVVVWVEEEMLDILLFVLVVNFCYWLQFVNFLLGWGWKHLLKGIKKTFFRLILHPKHPSPQLLSQCAKAWYMYENQKTRHASTLPLITLSSRACVVCLRESSAISAWRPVQGTKQLLSLKVWSAAQFSLSGPQMFDSCLQMD